MPPPYMISRGKGCKQNRNRDASTCCKSTDLHSKLKEGAGGEEGDDEAVSLEYFGRGRTKQSKQKAKK